MMTRKELIAELNQLRQANGFDPIRCTSYNKNTILHKIEEQQRMQGGAVPAPVIVTDDAYASAATPAYSVSTGTAGPDVTDYPNYPSATFVAPMTADQITHSDIRVAKQGVSLFPALGRRIPTSVSPTTTVGVMGTPVYGGFIQSHETNPELKFRRRYKTFSEIMLNTSIVAASIRYFLNLVSKTGWKVEPAPGPRGAEIAEMVESALHDMDTPWHRVVRRAAMYRFYGFGLQEWTAKRRDDGMLGFQDVQARSQFTIERWDVSEQGTVFGVTQRSPQDNREIYLPRSKLIYMVDDAMNDSPEGLGLFRHLVGPAKRLARYEQLEGIGFETDLRGIPIGRAPLALMQQAVEQGRMDPAVRARILENISDFIKSHLKNPERGLLLDSQPFTGQDDQRFPSTIQQWGLELARGDSPAMEEVNVAIDRVNRELARIMGTEHLLLGDGESGSEALSRDKSHNFGLIVESTMKEIREVMESDFVRPILDLNGVDRSLQPILKTHPVQFRSVQDVTRSLKDMAASGAILAPDDPAIGEVRDLLGLSAASTNIEGLAEAMGGLALSPTQIRDRSRLRDSNTARVEDDLGNTRAGDDVRT